MFGLHYLKNVVTLELERELCTGCGRCVEVCPHAVFEVADGKALIIDRDACMECGACSINCPAEAITIESGVGCAEAILRGALRGTEPTCDCSKDSDSCC